METRPRSLLVLSYALLFAFLASPAFGLQIGPAAATLTCTGVQTYSLRVINDQGEAIHVNVSVEGYPELVDANLSSFDMAADVPEQQVTITVDCTETGDLQPGRITVPVIITAGAAEESQFDSQVSLVHNLNLYLPYPGAYVEARLMLGFLQGRQGITLSLANRGSNATTVNGTLAILAPNGSSALSFPLGSIDLQAGAEGKLERWVTITEPGQYQANVSYGYDDQLGGRFEGSAASPSSCFTARSFLWWERQSFSARGCGGARSWRR